MIQYSTLGAGKQLNEIVFAGSHDAGIVSGGKNVKTQSLDVRGQADAGVRLFDIRITGAAVKDDPRGPGVTLKSYHGKGPEFSGKYKHAQTGDKVKVDVKSMLAGEFGLSLSKILDGAKGFVQANPSEFLILKFDHCSNWALIAEACVAGLDKSIYTGGGNVNTKTLGDLAGKVVVAFSSSALKALGGQFSAADGIVGIRNLKSGGAYDASYQGLQYFGKGGTSVAKPFGKIGQNIDTQRKLMKKGAQTHPEVMGMMYWTTTGVFESIKARNDKMWTKVKVQALKKLWNEGLYASIQERLGAAMQHGGAYARGGQLKAFMPNVVMIDFADDEKCKTIYSLNQAAAVDLADVASVLQL